MKKAVCVLILNDDGKILSVSRKDDHTAFGLPGGKVDPGETLPAAAIRETFEETSVNIEGLIPLYTGMCVDYEVTTFLATIAFPSSNPKGNSPSETGVIKWLTAEELSKGPFKDYNKELFQTLD